MSSDTLLTDLCSVCYTDKPKYRCPRCKTRTCSLTCSKKHKQRASCSGVRDPAEYRRKNELATPVGVDRDYNYLKSVERSMDVANRDAHARGIDVDERSQRVFRGNHPDSILQKYLIKNNITVHRAPKGMSRQKTNKTRASKRNHVLWTVEWVDDDDNKDCSDNCLESSSVIELRLHLESEKKNAAKRRLKEQKSSERPKRAKTSVSATTTAASIDPDDRIVKIEFTPSDVDSIKVKAEDNEPEETNFKSDAPFFYLLRTGTSSTSRVLIPLDGTASLTESLRNQTVLEYPTIYVLPHSPESLPPKFLLEKQYLKLRKGEEEELDDAVRKAEDGGMLPNATKEEIKAEPSANPDPNAILAMLKRDVTR